jgi:transcriptional regulator with XRE-family HTH domain
MLEQIRKLYGYTQTELAREAGITQNFFTSIETGKIRAASSLSKIAEVLQIKTSILLSQGEYIDYPFLADFYIFTPKERNVVQLYKLISDLICSKSEIIDAAFLFANPSEPDFVGETGEISLRHILLRDDRGTVFLFRRNHKSKISSSNRRVREDKERGITTFPMADSFRRILHSLNGTKVHERSLTETSDLSNKIEAGTVKKDDVLHLFPDVQFFHAQYDAHKAFKAATGGGHES